MRDEISNAVPIYLKVAEKIEDAILSGAFPEDTQVPSTTEISIHDKTAAEGRIFKKLYPRFNFRSAKTLPHEGRGDQFNRKRV